MMLTLSSVTRRQALGLLVLHARGALHGVCGLPLCADGYADLRGLLPVRA